MGKQQRKNKSGHQKRMASTVARRERRKRPRNFDGWSEKGWYTPDDPDVMFLLLDDYFDLLDGLPKELRSAICDMKRQFDYFEAGGLSAKAIGGILWQLFTHVRSNYVSLTAFVLFSNWSMWENYGRNEPLARVFNDFYMASNRFACETLTGDEAAYFYRWTD